MKNNIKNENSLNSQSKWAISLVNSITKSLEEDNEAEKVLKLNKYIEYFQDVILRNINWETAKNNTEKKIISWYNFNNNSYSAKNYKLDKNKGELLEKFKNDEFYIFKNIIERIWRELVSKLFQNQLWKNYSKDEEIWIKTLITSDSDDAFWKIDLIVILNEDWEESYLWIDIAVSDNSKYLESKIQKEDSQCIEFNLYKWLPLNTKIKRVVLDFERKVMANFLIEFFETIESNWVIDIKTVYNKHYNLKHNKNNKYVWLSISDIIWNTWNNIDRILTVKN